MASTSETRLAYVPETTWGTTPATPVFTNARFTGESLTPDLQTVVSNEIRPDRNVTDLIQVGQNAGGDVVFELSYGAFDDWIESVMYNTWTTNTIINGITEKSFTIEKTFETGVTDQFHRFAGAVASGMSLTMAVDAIVTGSFSFVCKGQTTATAIIPGATYNPAPTNDVMNAAVDFATLTITGVASPQLTNLTVNINNNLRQQRVIGSIDSRGIGTGRFEVTGELTAYFENSQLYDLYLNNTAADLSFEIGGAVNQKYLFEMGKIKFESAQVLAEGNDQDLFVTMSYRALFDEVDNTLKITRTP